MLVLIISFSSMFPVGLSYLSHHLTIFFLIVVSNLAECRSSLSLKQALSTSDHFRIIQENMPLFVNKTLIACVIVREPFVIYNEQEFSSLTEKEKATSDLNNYSGIAIEVVKRLSKIFKFKLKIVSPGDKQFGVLQTNNSWTGLIGLLVRNEADIGVTALSITVSRAQVVDFTRAYYVETAAILLRIPEEVQNYFAIFEPFSAGVWFLLSATMIILIFLITIMTKLEEKQGEQHRMSRIAKLLKKQALLSSKSETRPETASRKRKSISVEHKLATLRGLNPSAKLEFGSNWLDRFYYSTTCVINILLIRDIKKPPHQTPIRILVCVWWLSTIVIVNIYFGILFGQLVVPRQPKTIETLEELVNQNSIGWSVTKGSAIYELFRKSPPNSVYGQLGLSMKNVTTADEGVENVINQGSAFIRERSILTFKVAQEHMRIHECKLQLAKEDFFSVGFGLGLAKNSSYLKPFNSALTLMIENGFVSHWQSMYWPTRNRFTECGLQPLPEGEPLSMKHFMSIYLVCSLIIGLSLVILVYQTIDVNLVEKKLKPMLMRLRLAGQR